jgi:phosphoribosylanthranilate isomerase
MSRADGTTFVKICGITRLSDARVAVRAGANAVGFVFAPSPRRVSAGRARSISSRLHPATRRIGVFVDESPERVLAVADEARLDGVQLHGNEPLEVIREIRTAAPGLFLVKAIRVGGPQPVALGARLLAESLVDAVMLDTKDPADLAGPRLSIEQVPDVAGGTSGHLVLAGGLTPENVAGLVRGIRPWGVDVSSGVESTPGRKDPDKVRAFLRAVREAESEAV